MRVTLFLMVAVVTAMSQTTEPPEEASPFVAGKVEVGDLTMPYRLLRPPLVEPDKRYPLVLFLHGSGERGDDNEKQLAYLPRIMAEPKRRASHPCFLLAPQCPEGTYWNEIGRKKMESQGLDVPPTPAMRGAMAALREVVRSHPVDPDRVYLTGLSIGGFGAWELAARCPDWFAACVPVCGGGHPSYAPRLVGLPIHAWHGAEDRVVPPAATRRMVEAVRAAGGAVEWSELKGVRHNSWIQAYGERGAIEAMFRHRRRTPERPIPGLEQVRRAAGLRAGEQIVFLGDSITQAGAMTGGYVDLIRKALASRKDAKRIGVIGAGISGHKVPDLEKRLERDVIEKGATLVFMYIGINDVWHSKSGRGTSKEDFGAGLERLVDRMQASGATVVLATPTVIGECAAGTNELDTMLDAYSEVGRRVAREKGLTLVDLRREIIDYLAVLNPANASHGILTTDGVHMNPAGNRFLADRAAHGLAKALATRGRAKAPDSK